MDVRQSHFLLEIRDVTRRYTLPRESLFKPPAEVQALRGVSLQVTAGRSMGIVGESGSGKTSMATALMRLLPKNVELFRGSIQLDGQELLLHGFARECVDKARIHDPEFVDLAAVVLLD